MSVSRVTPMYSDPALVAGKKKRVLLVDTSRVKRDLRSETLRRLGVEVDCAADVTEARCWWRADLYDLVLIHVDDSPVPLDKFCNDMRAATPPQQIMFLVGGPAYLSASPSSDLALAQSESDPHPISANEMALRSELNGSDGRPQRWGILEACRRISAIRSVCDARTRAIRDRPSPPRDSEISRSTRVNETDALAVLIREEMQ
jgi:hypothetical protein